MCQVVIALFVKNLTHLISSTYPVFNVIVSDEPIHFSTSDTDIDINIRGLVSIDNDPKRNDLKRFGDINILNCKLIW